MVRGGESAWYVKDADGERGPLNESEMRRQLQLSTNAELQVRQGSSGWHPADEVRRKIEVLAKHGIRIKFGNTVEGPFTLTRAYELLKNNPMDQVEVKSGAEGPWFAAAVWLEAIRQRKRLTKRESKH